MTSNGPFFTEEKRKAVVGILILCFVFALPLVVCVYWRYATKEVTEDAIAYMSPCIGAVLAGGVFYLKKENERLYYLYSFALVIVGVVAYTLAHPALIGSKVAVLSLLIAWATCMSVALVYRVCAHESMEEPVYLTMTGIVLAALAVLACLGCLLGLIFFYDQYAALLKSLIKSS